MARLHADEHFPVNVVYKLRLLGHDVDTVRELGESKYGDGIPDDQVLANASKHHAAVLTKNICDFRPLHKSSADHFGIIVCKFHDSSNPKRIAKLIDDAIKGVGNLRGQWIPVIDQIN